MNNRETAKDFADAYKSILVEEYSGLTLPCRDTFVVTSPNDDLKIIDVAQILDDPDSNNNKKVNIEKNDPDSIVVDRPAKQDRFSLTKKVVLKNFDYDPSIPIKHDKEKIGSYMADRYLMQFEYNATPVSLIVTNWYAHAVYLIKSSEYKCSYNRRELLEHGAKRFNWIDEKVTEGSLLTKLTEKLEELVP